LWFNHNFSSLYNICQLIKRGVIEFGFPSSLDISVSHSNPEFVASQIADVFFLDQGLNDPEAYVDWCLNQCQSRKIDLFWPSRGATAIAKRAAEFTALKTRLIIPAAAETLDLINDKAAFYSLVSQAGYKVPRFRVVNNFREFNEAIDHFKSLGVPICFKPAKSIYGLGFKIIKEETDPLADFLANDPVKVTLSEAKSRLNVPDERFVKLLVMERALGVEHSLDCLAQNGRLLRVSIRKKPPLGGQAERLIQNEAFSSLAQSLTQFFQLSWIFNLQLIEIDSGPLILEINPRMAGGLYFSCLAGINYPYWAVRLALEPRENLLPNQVYDLMVNQVYQPFIYANDPKP
jgi:biotin carboxylase